VAHTKQWNAHTCDAGRYLCNLGSRLNKQLNVLRNRLYGINNRLNKQLNVLRNKPSDRFFELDNDDNRSKRTALLPFLGPDGKTIARSDCQSPHVAVLSRFL
jgi:hypothetical protein